MKIFDPELFKRKIIMISDFVDSSEYLLGELEPENELINLFKSGMKDLGADFRYVEVKTLDDLDKALKGCNRYNSIIFNWCEEIEGKHNSSYLVTEYLDKKNLIYTGAASDCLKLTGSKVDTKVALENVGLVTPKYFVVEDNDDIEDITISSPSIVKLANEHCSLGMEGDNLVENNQQLLALSSRLLPKYQQKILVEEFIDAPEYTASVWGNDRGAEVVAYFSVLFADKSIGKFQTNTAKNMEWTPEYANTSYVAVDKATREEFEKNISKDILKAYNTLRLRDYGRFEIRIRDGVCYFLDANANPMLWLNNEFFIQTQKMGYSVAGFILKVCEFALHRSK